MWLQVATTSPPGGCKEGKRGMGKSMLQLAIGAAQMSKGAMPFDIPCQQLTKRQSAAVTHGFSAGRPETPA